MSKQAKILLVTTILIALFGVVMVYSASYITAQENFGNPFFYASKQLICWVLGIITMIIISKISPEFFNKIFFIVYIIGFVLLAIVFIPGLSNTSYGATRWINLGFISFQPSEIAKFCLIIFLAGYVCKKDITNKFWHLAGALVLGGLYCLLIILEPNMSITICVGLTLLFMLFVGGARPSFFVLSIIPLIGLAVILIIIEPYRLDRIIAFLNPWKNPLSEGYQLIQSLYAISSGGFFGVGLFNSRQAHLFLPFSESDFIFSIIVEELGLVGGFLLIIAFAIMIIQIFKISIKSKNKFNSILGMGIGAIIFIQVIINIAVVTGSIPPTGLPLPFISAGGTSLIAFMAAIGIVIGIDRDNSLKQPEKHTMFYDKKRFSNKRGKQTFWRS